MRPDVSVTIRSVLFFSSRRRHTRCLSDWSSDVCSSDLIRNVRACNQQDSRGNGEYQDAQHLQPASLSFRLPICGESASAVRLRILRRQVCAQGLQLTCGLAQRGTWPQPRVEFEFADCSWRVSLVRSPHHPTRLWNINLRIDQSLGPSESGWQNSQYGCESSFDFDCLTNRSEEHTSELQSLRHLV